LIPHRIEPQVPACQVGDTRFSQVSHLRLYFQATFDFSRKAQESEISIQTVARSLQRIVRFSDEREFKAPNSVKMTEEQHRANIRAFVTEITHRLTMLMTELCTDHRLLNVRETHKPSFGKRSSQLAEKSTARAESIRESKMGKKNQNANQQKPTGNSSGDVTTAPQMPQMQN
jgi:hypothetical protein